MRICHEIHEISRIGDQVVVALGNFDGVHVGHQQLIRAMVAEAKGQKMPSVVFTFHPHPIKVLFPNKAPGMLTSLRKRSDLIASLGTDCLLVMNFDQQLARLSPEYFVNEILATQLRARAVYVGFNYSFGHRGAGTPDLLQSMGKNLGIKVVVFPPVKVGKTVVSSSEVRSAILAGEIEKARSLLGYWPIIDGEVVRGEQRGRRIGFPTANIAPAEEILLPPQGVYVARVEVSGEWYDGVVNIGVKPTFGSGLTQTTEVHILDFAGNIYGQNISLFLLKRLRSEMAFSSVEELKSQIGRDIELARHLRPAVLFQQG